MLIRLTVIVNVVLSFGSHVKPGISDLLSRSYLAKWRRQSFRRNFMGFSEIKSVATLRYCSLGCPKKGVEYIDFSFKTRLINKVLMNETCF